MSCSSWQLVWCRSIRGLHQVKRKETIFGISRMYDLTIEELLEANPEMKEPGYELKKGTMLKIPYPGKTSSASNPSSSSMPSSSSNASQASQASSASNNSGIADRPIRLGVMLPLHDINGDGRRMVEYYRGVLMACDSLKKLGISVDVHAWNAAEDANIPQLLTDPAAANCDLIIGPLYQCAPVGGQPSYLPGVSDTHGAERICHHAFPAEV